MSEDISPAQTAPEASGASLSGKDWVLTQAFTRLQQRQFSDALKLLQGLRVLSPEDPEVYRMLSYALLMADQPEECLAMADRYQQCMPPGTDTQEISWIQGRAEVRLEKARLEKANEQPGDTPQ
ncbi:tetratricopeptide repeat protein [Parendozoicomonas sp. Alg238-R29]|uniref:tetratricopeptide repeat protein n=1 Tax=Parendozoicomonas sp. Alg238-R29 TaxID=2993446 RepID=UPI00248EE547|nr:tetratricopeptide repeat protein [Parendozoicomonas sp. Alg238-R29]